MPIVVNNLINGNSKLGVWKLTEAIEELEAIFPFIPEETTYYNNLKNDKRKREWIVARILITELLKQRVLIKYTNYGKPYIDNNSSKISISHSKNHVAVIISNKFSPGIDIEHIADRVQKVKHKFLQTQELEWCNNNELMTLCWSAKEAIFKIFEKELDFHDIVISKFDESDSWFNASTNKNTPTTNFRVYFDRIENDVLTYTFQLY